MENKWRWLPVVLGGGWLGYHWLSRRTGRPLPKAARPDSQATPTPTVFIPGWGGNAWTYNGMLRWFARQGYAAKVLTVRVDYRNHLHFRGTWTGQADNPTIQVLFDRNLTLDYRQQTRWVTQILRALHRRYGVTSYNAVAHSWGGSAMVQSLVQDGADPSLPRLRRLILLGTPVDESQTDQPDPAYQRLLTLRQNLWANAGAEIHNVYGRLAGHATDGQVPVWQATALREVVAQSPIHYTEHPIPGLGHGRLHSALKMWQLIAQLLWVKKDD
ncbi:hypothetical protein LZY01_12900 [Levilactobacillus zymae]|uniref:Alpha/beta hydrolase n=1 Tax=Levilactobacillus zymae TaxID=267363 RepID=A0ABQ0WXD8_9LACO|nr:alpha/beta hydrolase [Levilactobacillus zymae]KRL08720.1 alpha beta hydrolase [Levilactobacillus zymae DSM 19395]QFR61556.1 alpha/beta hydrolase [Levilactobacillus zymae]GEO72122.1 hypothetical protein LZY01_12900 [Levilactobacillus zymae]